MPFFKLGIQITVIPAQCRNVRNGYWLLIIPPVPRVSLVTFLLLTQDSLNTDSTAWLISIQINSITFQKYQGCTSDYPSTTECQVCVEGVMLTAQNFFKAILYLNSGALVLHWKEFPLARKNPLLLWQCRLSSPSLSSCFMVLFCLENRSHLRKETCDTSENLASTDTGSMVSTWCLCLELDWRTSWAEKLSQRPGLKANTGSH